ncbi:methyltransferase domain-containing protein [Patescibacteria group bacterium]|nr:methyltransferase domain-containing protein [Patescibacteria group bacterium]MBU1499444.1 methyltransferase domain-containing protein [Patescibacteria group bacterium]
MSIHTTKEYFKKKADQYDDVDKQLYWVFSDELLWFNLKKTLDKQPDSFSFLDAGGGTGRWTQKILQTYPKSRGILFDLSESMLRVAENKLKHYEKEGRLKIIQGNFENPAAIKNLKADVSFNFHNVIGFVKNPSLFISHLVKCTNNQGYIISFVPNAYHGMYFNISIGNLGEAKTILRTKKGKFSQEMPSINFFTPDEIKQLYIKNKLSLIWVTGFPNLIYPNFQETQISGQTTSLKKLLSVESNYRTLIEIEKKICVNSDLVARGNNIYIVGRK